jgi:secretory phospholipase A2
MNKRIRKAYETFRIHVIQDTKWCGEGTIAKNFDDLGQERFADMCCRAHDHCPRSLDSNAYDQQFDLRNPIGYTM